ncbi:hypothetical protein ABH925_005828 [Streptacidiphilus sp. EB129]
MDVGPSLGRQWQPPHWQGPPDWQPQPHPGPQPQEAAVGRGIRSKRAAGDSAVGGAGGAGVCVIG